MCVLDQPPNSTCWARVACSKINQLNELVNCCKGVATRAAPSQHVILPSTRCIFAAQQCFSAAQREHCVELVHKPVFTRSAGCFAKERHTVELFAFDGSIHSGGRGYRGRGGCSPLYPNHRARSRRTATRRRTGGSTGGYCRRLCGRWCGHATVVQRPCYQRADRRIDSCHGLGAPSVV